MEYLQNHKDLPKLKEIIQRIHSEQLKTDPESARSLKEPLQNILKSIVEETWKDSDQPEPLPETTSSAQSKLQKKSQSVHKQYLQAYRSKQSPKASFMAKSSPTLSLNKSLMTSPEQEASHFSEFSHIVGPGSFTRATRKTTDFRATSPGPAAYSSNSSFVRPNSPKAVFNKAGNRSSYIPNFSSPGPSAYYPSKHYYSKH